jgi:hypothetical protein
MGGAGWLIARGQLLVGGKRWASMHTALSTLGALFAPSTGMCPRGHEIAFLGVLNMADLKALRSAMGLIPKRTKRWATPTAKENRLQPINIWLTPVTPYSR